MDYFSFTTSTKITLIEYKDDNNYPIISVYVSYDIMYLSLIILNAMSNYTMFKESIDTVTFVKRKFPLKYEKYLSYKFSTHGNLAEYWLDLCNISAENVLNKHYFTNEYRYIFDIDLRELSHISDNYYSVSYFIPSYDDRINPGPNHNYFIPVIVIHSIKLDKYVPHNKVTLLISFYINYHAFNLDRKNYHKLNTCIRCLVILTLPNTIRYFLCIMLWNMCISIVVIFTQWMILKDFKPD